MLKDVINLENAPNVNSIKNKFRELFPFDDIIFDNNFYVRVAALDNPDGTVKHMVKISFRYNIFLSVFVENIQLCYRDPDLNYKEILSYNLDDYLNAEERKAVNYVKGFIKSCKEQVRARTGNHNVSEEQLSSMIDNMKPDFFRAPGTNSVNFNIESIYDKVETLKTNPAGECFLYSDQVFTRGDVEKINFSSDYKDILEFEENHNPLNDHENFQNSCFEMIENGIDPIQPFMKLNAFSTVDNRKNLSEKDKILISQFISKSDIPSLMWEDVRDFNSGITVSNGFHNMKRLTRTVILDQETNYHDSLFMNLVTKSRDDSNSCVISKKVSSIDCSSEAFTSINSTKIGKHNKTPDLPIQWLNPAGRIESIFNNYASLSENFYVYFMDRPVSRINTSTYVQRTISGGDQGSLSFNKKYTCKSIVPIDGSTNTTIQSRRVGESYDYSISRIYSMKKNTKESALNSRVFRSSLFQKLKSTSCSSFEQKLRNTHVYGFCSHQENETGDIMYPVNIIKLCNLDPGLRVSKITFESSLVKPTRLPFHDDAGESVYTHLDPVPGVEYVYKLYLSERYTGTLPKNNVLEVKIYTFSNSNSGVKLSSLQELDKSGDLEKWRVKISQEDLENYRTNKINKLLNQIYPVINGDDNPRMQFATRLKESINQDLSIVGNSFKLLVQKIDKSTGAPIAEEILDVIVKEEPERPDIGQPARTFRYFDISIPKLDRRDYFVTYNLIVNNPFHDEGINIEEMQEGDDGFKMRYLRKTSKFFNSITLNTHILPGGNSDVESFNFSSKLPSSINRVTCVGGWFERYAISNRPEFNVSNFTVVSNSSYGDFILEWDLAPTDVTSHESVDFFIITATLIDFNERSIIEVPIGAVPYIDDGTKPIPTPIRSTFRTESFEGVAFKVKFGIYIITNNFNIYNSGLETNKLTVASPKYSTDGKRVM